MKKHQQTAAERAQELAERKKELVMQAITRIISPSLDIMGEAFAGGFYPADILTVAGIDPAIVEAAPLETVLDKLRKEYHIDI